jgi:cardiolipin synthase
MVDGRVAAQRAHDPPVRWLEEQAAAARASGSPIPLEVVRWRDPSRQFDGLHQKILICDGSEAIVGGMNFGDVYSHRNPKETQRWRDTDLLIEGADALRPLEELFADSWNDHAERWSHVSRIERATPAPENKSSSGRPSRIAFVSAAPSERDRILLSLVKAIRGAQRSIEIENAYVIRMAPLDEALKGAIARGVRVRVLSNSPESLDEPTLSYGIVETLLGLAAAGAEVYAKTGPTLHSKFVVIDGVFAQVGSYNLHPRSHRLEHEIVANVLGGDAPTSLSAAFERDIAAARRIHGPADLAHPTDPLARLAWLWFADLL